MSVSFIAELSPVYCCLVFGDIDFAYICSSKVGFAPNGIKSLKIGSPVNKSLGQCGRLVRYRDVVGRAPWHRDITHQGVSGYRRNPPSPNRLDVTLKVRILNKILPIMMMKTIWH